MKARIRFTEYGTWILINFGFCVLPIFISGYFVHGFDNGVISSFISFIYTTLICSIYAYKNGNENNFIFFGAWLVVIFFLLLYVSYPEKISYDTYCYIRSNPTKVCFITIFLILIISLILNNKSLEDVVERKLTEKIQKNASKIGKDVNGMLQQLKNEKP